MGDYCDNILLAQVPYHGTRSKHFMLLLCGRLSQKIALAGTLGINSGGYVYLTSTYDTKDSVTSHGPSLSRTFTSSFSYLDSVGGYIDGSYTAQDSASYGVLRSKTTSNLHGVV